MFKFERHIALRTVALSSSLLVFFLVHNQYSSLKTAGIPMGESLRLTSLLNMDH
jgi:hypothetical protein